MADTAFQTQYRQEFIAGFEAKQSLLRDLVTTEAVIKGNTAVFLVADSGSATAQTRGVNGLIPARADNLTQQSCTPVGMARPRAQDGLQHLRVAGQPARDHAGDHDGRRQPQDRRPDHRRS
jgi:hypothetical protein